MIHKQMLPLHISVRLPDQENHDMAYKALMVRINAVLQSELSKWRAEDPESRAYSMFVPTEGPYMDWSDPCNGTLVGRHSFAGAGTYTGSGNAQVQYNRVSAIEPEMVMISEAK